MKKVSYKEFHSAMKEVLKNNPALAQSFEQEKIMGRGAIAKLDKELRKAAHERYLAKNN